MPDRTHVRDRMRLAMEANLKAGQKLSDALMEFENIELAYLDLLREIEKGRAAIIKNKVAIQNAMGNAYSSAGMLLDACVEENDRLRAEYGTAVSS
jgi:hypothetical protein